MIPLVERSLCCCGFSAAEAHAYAHNDHKNGDCSQDATKDFIEVSNDLTSRYHRESEIYEFRSSVSLKKEEERNRERAYQDYHR